MKYILAFYSVEHGLEHKVCFDGDDLLEHIERFLSFMTELSTKDKNEYIDQARDQINGNHFGYNTNLVNARNPNSVVGEYHVLVIR